MDKVTNKEDHPKEGEQRTSNYSKINQHTVNARPLATTNSRHTKLSPPIRRANTALTEVPEA
jgi:hypothetical protein